MQPRTRQRLVRSIVASLMQSDLTASELRELAEEFSEGKLGREVGRFLREILFSVRDFENRKEHPRNNKLEASSIEALAHDVVRRRKISKRVLADMVTKVAPHLDPRSLGSAGTIHDMLERFFQQSSPRQHQDFINLLESRSVEDPFLRGIVGRS